MSLLSTGPSCDRGPLKHWERLTRFLEVPGAPLDNNLCEQTLKMAIRHRKNSYFYKTMPGAAVGDLYMSLIDTCYLSGADRVGLRPPNGQPLRPDLCTTDDRCVAAPSRNSRLPLHACRSLRRRRGGRVARSWPSAAPPSWPASRAAAKILQPYRKHTDFLFMPSLERPRDTVT